MNIPEETSLLIGLANEENEAIERIYRENYQMIHSLVLNNSGSSDDAADVFQETMIVLFEKSRLPGFELTCQLKTYIYSVSRRLWLKKLQSSQRMYKTLENTHDVISVDEDMEVHEKRHNDFMIMDSALGKIGEPCKSLLEAYYVEKKQMQQIATDFGYTNADNAKTQKYKCLVRLKKLFFAQYKNGQ
ncbi:MAG: sigma-70 family RNA polymerase sigma factor [Ferruginibacter sp.]